MKCLPDGYKKFNDQTEPRSGGSGNGPYPFGLRNGRFGFRNGLFGFRKGHFRFRTAVSDSETIVSESKWVRKRTGTKLIVRGALRLMSRGPPARLFASFCILTHFGLRKQTVNIRFIRAFIFCALCNGLLERWPPANFFVRRCFVVRSPRFFR